MTPADSTHPPIRFSARDGQSGTWLLKAAIGFMAISVAGLLYVFVGVDSLPFHIERPYLIPWVIATGVVILAPLVYLKKKGQFSLVHPLTYAAASYFFPIFFLGGWSLVFGLSNYYYLAFVNDPEFDFPLTFFYIIIGYASLSIGFLISPGRKVGERIARRLPVNDFTLTELFFGGLVFLLLGFYVILVALEMGQIGYQSAVFGDVGSLNAFLTFVVPVSSFLLWVAFFQQSRWNVFKTVILASQLIAAGFMLFAFANKSSLINSVIYMMGAFVLVKRKILFRNWVGLSAALGIALALGLIYGPTFRSIKGNDERVSVASYLDLAFETVTSIGDQGGVASISDSLGQLAERLEIASSLAVVVSNYEGLRQYEADYGLENNIWQYTWTAFIPRFLWKDKPQIADNFSYNELYFGYGGFGLAITSMGDLLRNFGPVGVPVGMFVLGFLLRIFYAALIEGQPFSAWRSVVYFIVLTKISYDSFYGEILPSTIRIAAIVVAQLLIIRLGSRLFSFRRS